MKSKRFRIILIYWTAVIVLLPRAAFAYIDPATTTYLIQIATALVVMAGVSLTIFLYRFRMISSKIRFWIFGIVYRIRHKNKDGPEKQKTETEKRREPYILPEYAIPGSAEPPEPSSFDGDVRKILQKIIETKNHDKDKKNALTDKTYKGRLRMLIPLAAAFGFTFIVIGCLELAVRYAPEIPFNLTRILPTVLLVFAVVTFVLIVIVPLFRGRVFQVLIILGITFLVAGYIQGNFLNWGIGALTGDEVIWSYLRAQFAASLICWTGCLVLMTLLYRYARKFWNRFIIFVPLLLILLQGVSLISAVSSNVNEGVWGRGVFWQYADENLTIDRINDVASEKNTVLIVLDRLDQTIIEDITAEDPHFFDQLDGFTAFDDYITWFGGTMLSVSGLLTGHRYVYDKTLDDYLNFAWANANMLQAYTDRGADIRLYMERGGGFNNIKQVRGIANNVFKGELGINKRIALVKLLKLSGYRYAPMPVKQFFWISPYEFMDTIELTDQTAPYMVNDFAFYERLISDGINKSDYKESFVYYHLQGAHTPHTMDENIQYTEESSYTRQTKGAFGIVYEYLRQLKDLGLYDDATIIITGDHGIFQGEELTSPARVGLFVKPAGSYETPLKISNAHVSQSQMNATIMESLTGEKGRFGDTFFDIGVDGNIIREYAINLWRYEITGDGRDFSNWRFIGLFPDTYT